jgi:hypothetical protein
MQAFHADVVGRDWGYFIAALIEFSSWYSIDLENHVAWKMQYNSTRPYKHGKAY